MSLERKLIALAFCRMARGVSPKAAFASSFGFYRTKKIGV